jgi:GrpB-like predicted nucleotidyltransferase (UPF0157 family)
MSEPFDFALGLASGVVHLVPHQQDWSAMYEAEKKRLLTAVKRYILDIQHVGSTAIPGIPAKPIIDIGIAVQNFEQAAVCIEPIVALGYVYVGENGIPRRHYFRKTDENGRRTHHLHLNEITGLDWANQIDFRDYLRQHPETAAQYARLKTGLAQQYPTDRLAYLDGKAPFIETTLHLARQGKSTLEK